MDANLKKSGSRIFTEINDRLSQIMPSTSGPQTTNAA